MNPLSWKELGILVKRVSKDLINGPTNSQARLRLFGQPESSVKVTLYRDNHGWCPYCQKIWLWLEEKRVPYKVEKVTMFCYGEKESWYKDICPSGVLPSLKLNGNFIAESDTILTALEKQFGPLHAKMDEPRVMKLRQLERELFSEWCKWLFYPASFPGFIQKQIFIGAAKIVDEALSSTSGPYFFEEFSTADVVFVPTIERMNASLFYYKGFNLRDVKAFPNISNWFDALETRETYLGIQSDFHTHCHDLHHLHHLEHMPPPKMAGVYENGDKLQIDNRNRIDSCVDFNLPETKIPEPSESRNYALERILKHREPIIKVNPIEDEKIDQALRAAMTYMMTEKMTDIPKGSEIGLRYLMDRVCVPRDMPIWSARRLREALKTVSESAGNTPDPDIPVEPRIFNNGIQDRKDQDPKYFKRQQACSQII